MVSESGVDILISFLDKCGERRALAIPMEPWLYVMSAEELHFEVLSILDKGSQLLSWRIVSNNCLRR